LSDSLKVLNQIVKELVDKAWTIDKLAVDFQSDLNLRQKLLQEYQSWYREARELLRANDFSGFSEFEQAYGGPGDNFDFYINHYEQPPSDPYDPDYEKHFKKPLDVQIALLGALPSEIQGKSINYLRALSSEISIDELEQAKTLLSNGFERAAGVVARVSLERHIKSIYQTTISVSSIPKFDQCIIELTKKGVFEERQRKQLAALYNVGSDCAHAGKTVEKEEIAKLISDILTIVTIWK